MASKAAIAKGIFRLVANFIPGRLGKEIADVEAALEGAGNKKTKAVNTTIQSFEFTKELAKISGKPRFQAGVAKINDAIVELANAAQEMSDEDDTDPAPEVPAA